MKRVLAYKLQGNDRKTLFSPIKYEPSKETVLIKGEIPFKITGKTGNLDKDYLIINVEPDIERSSRLEFFNKLSNSWIHPENLQKYFKEGIEIKGPSDNK